MALKTRKPTGRVAPPLILVEGGEKLGKSISAALLSASDKVGQTYWIEFGEVTADEYGLVPGARYEIVEHDGSYASIHQAVSEVRDEAQKAKDAGGKPVVLVIDSMSAEWDLLKTWATNRAKGSKSNRAKLAADPHAEITVSGNYWNDANDRHYKLIRMLQTFPGIVVLIARGKEVAAIGENGQPIEGKKTYRVEGQKMLGFDVSCWLRLTPGDGAYIIGCRSVFNGVRPTEDQPKRLDADWSLEWLVFDFLKFDLATSGTPALVEPKPERTPEQMADEVLLPATTVDRLGELWSEAKQFQYDSVAIQNERGQEELLLNLIRRVGLERRAAGPATAEQHTRMGELWTLASDFDDQESRLRFTAEIVGRKVDAAADLTAAEADKVIARVDTYVKQNTPPAAPSEQPETAGAPA